MLKYKEAYGYLWDKCVEPLWDSYEQFEKDEISNELDRIFGKRRNC